MAKTATKKSTSARTLHFDKLSETKGTWRYQERVADDAEPVIGTLYVKKHALQSLGSPDALTVTVAGA